MKIFFLLNPTRVKNRWDWREVAARHAKRFGWTPRFGDVDRSLPRSTDKLIGQAFEEDCSRIVVVGGDGSIHRAIRAIADQKKLKTCEIGIVPAGTCNDFARSLGLRRRQWDNALRVACSGKIRPTDLGLMDKSLFINNAGFGRRPPPPGRKTKPIQTLRAFRPLRLKAQWDKGSIEGAFYMGLICNAPYFSGGLYFSKNVNAQDGLLDLFFIPAMSKWRLLPALAWGRLGRPTRVKRLVSLRIPQLQIETEEDIWPQADGEPARAATRRVNFALSPEKAMIVAP